MFAFPRAAVLALALLFPLAASAHAWGHRRAAVASYYYAAPASYYYYGPSVPVIYAQPAPFVAAPIYAPVSPPVYAVPTPAPAISSPAPAAPLPPMPPAAGVIESRSSYPETRSYYLAPTTASAGIVPVAFWNRSPQDLWVRMAGEWRLLRQGRGVTLDLPREFAWQVQGRGPQREHIPAGETALQIVIRR